MIVDRFINYPGHERRKIDSINGPKKTYLKQKMCMIGTEESNNESTIMNADSIIYDKNKELKTRIFAEDWLNLCSYGNMKTGVNMD